MPVAVSGHAFDHDPIPLRGSTPVRPARCYSASMCRVARLWVYLLPALATTAVTFLLAVISVVVGPTHECEECPGTTGASPGQTDQWLVTVGVSVLALLLAWVATAVVVAITRGDDVRIRVVPLLVVVLFALGPATVAGVAVGISVANNANPAGYRN
jgi:hypothetical protein